MHKSKKKSTKTAKIPKPIKIKKEKTEEDRTPQPMSHYVDDRLELIKQIFGTLKPKTITNLAPDFLKKKELEEIQENCLNELLGISKKRLLSIIAATKCPTDTESSSDSDVNNIEEHVSLEEISSDSEIGEDGAKTSKKKSSAIGGGKGETKKNGVKNGAEKNENSGQISVLELLELQARARAIRSQLALEPVTKIEVDSDNDSDDKSSTKSKESRSSSRKERKRKSDEQAKTSKKNKSNGVTASSSVSDKTLKVIRPNVEPTKKIKLKRNFRTNKPDTMSTTEHENRSEDEPKSNTTTSKIVKEEKRSRSVSPDVIPIVAETVTLMISDSSDDEGVKNTKAVAQQELKRVKDVIEVHSSNRAPEINKEQEDGEILDETELRTQRNNVQNNESNNIAENAAYKENIAKAADDCSNDKSDSNDTVQSTAKVSSVEQPIECNTTDTSKEAVAENKIAVQNDVKAAEPTAVNTSVTVAAPENKSIEDDYDDDQNDDVISIEGGDLETEMTEHLEKDNSNAESSQSSSAASRNKEMKEADTEQTATNVTQVAEDDIISLNSSDDEPTKQSSESWNSRWLKSSKVSKVLATSRLGKRVRDKIKKTKRTKKDITREAAEAAALAEANKNNSAYTSKHEDGSIEQYKELLEMRQQRKN